jgi:hypothetical protein
MNFAQQADAPLNAEDFAVWAWLLGRVGCWDSDDNIIVSGNNRDCSAFRRPAIDAA